MAGRQMVCHYSLTVGIVGSSPTRPASPFLYYGAVGVIGNPPVCDTGDLRIRVPYGPPYG